MPQRPPRDCSPARPPAAFTLLETMVVVAILSIIAALAVPNLLPVVRQQRHSGNVSTVAGFMARARQEAMSRRRCVRVRAESDRLLVSELLNAFDCDRPADDIRIDPRQPLYLPLASLRLDDGGSVTFTPAPPRQPPAEPVQFRFRPTGRLWTVDGTARRAPGPTAGALTLRLDGVPTPGVVVVEAPGLICAETRIPAAFNPGVPACPSP